MFEDVEQFITEVEAHECLWNTKSKDYTSRNYRRKAWIEIAEACNPDWSSSSIQSQERQVDEIMKKWKHIRDYYFRIKRLSGIEGNKRKKPSYFASLAFLDTKDECNNGSDSEAADESDDSDEPLLTEHITVRSKTKSISKNSNSNINQSEQNFPTIQREYNSNTHFLLSLQTMMDAMNEDQNLEFRLAVMGLIKDIRQHGTSNSNDALKSEPGSTYF